MVNVRKIIKVREGRNRPSSVISVHFHVDFIHQPKSTKSLNAKPNYRFAKCLLALTFCVFSMHNNICCSKEKTNVLP